MKCITEIKDKGFQMFPYHLRCAKGPKDKWSYSLKRGLTKCSKNGLQFLKLLHVLSQGICDKHRTHLLLLISIKSEPARSPALWDVGNILKPLIRASSLFPGTSYLLQASGPLHFPKYYNKTVNQDKRGERNWRKTEGWYD